MSASMTSICPDSSLTTSFTLVNLSVSSSLNSSTAASCPSAVSPAGNTFERIVYRLYSSFSLYCCSNFPAYTGLTASLFSRSISIQSLTSVPSSFAAVLGKRSLVREVYPPIRSFREYFLMISVRVAANSSGLNAPYRLRCPLPQKDSFVIIFP